MINPILANFEDSPGYVYLMHSHGKYKIGKSGWPIDRHKSFKTGNPDIELVEEWCCFDISKIESFLHRFFQSERVRDTKEWFLLSESQLNFLRSLDDHALMSWMIDHSGCEIEEFKTTEHWKRLLEHTYLCFSIVDPQTILLTRFEGTKPTRSEILKLWEEKPNELISCSHVMKAIKTKEGMQLTWYVNVED